MDEAMQDRLTIREMIDKWVVYRDSGDWERFRDLWHDGGEMNATWMQGNVDAFLRASRGGWEKGVKVWHTLGATASDLAGPRAIAQTKMTLQQRAFVHDVECDVTCTGRFYDFLEKRRGVWGFVVRQGIYEKDRIDTVDPAATLELDRKLLERFPEGYRHLAYLQETAGMTVKLDMPGLRGPGVEALYARGQRWLSGQPI
ncbi:MAG: nuclear transport factor 2 family protein [Alphaproteobacteria bacterium]